MVPGSPSVRRNQRNTIAAAIRRRRWGRRGAFFAAGLLGISVLLGRAGCFGYRGDDWAAFDRQTVRVERAVDGQTLAVTAPDGTSEHVHLVGVVAPAGAEYRSSESRQALDDRAAGKSVVLRLEPTRSRDSNGDLLATVYLPPAGNLNLALIRDGEAYAERRVAYAFRPQAEQAESEARQHHKRLWKGVTEAGMPAWRQQWLREQRERRERRNASPGTRPAR